MRASVVIERFKRSIFFYLLVTAAPLLACTGIRLTASDGSVVSGRTLEFGVPIELNIAVIPRNFAFIGKTPSGNGLLYKTKYAAVGTCCFDDPALMDGINEKGLSAAAFYFPGFAQYAPETKDNQSKALSPVEFPNWILTQFATIDEVKAALSSIAIVPTVIQGWGPTPAPLHYIVYDRQGRSIVIEPINGEMIVHENPLGVITNSPTFDWHMTHLRSFINLTPFNAPPITLGQVQLAPFGQGSGMVGLPGDFTPPSRFVRAAIFSVTASISDSAEEAVAQAFHILNQFDIPLGLVRQKAQTAISTDYTMATAVKDAKTLRYYYKSYENQTIQFVDLMKFDLRAKAIKKMKITGKQVPVDVSSGLASN